MKSTCAPSTTATRTGWATFAALPRSSIICRTSASPPSGCCRSFPSPWRDDGYDISDYNDVHPSYGTLRDFQNFLKQAHRRGIRVLTEVVLNHTSDQHPWFQRSRRAAPGTRWRDFYVWSDTPDKYQDARIIFKDFETSNWTWDPVAKAYYWHRFYSHQPDLNFDNPARARSDPGGDRFLVRPRRRRIPPGRRALSLRARRHQLRESPRDPRLPATSCARMSIRNTRTASCSPKPTSGPRTLSPISPTATNATWHFTFP